MNYTLCTILTSLDLIGGALKISKGRLPRSGVNHISKTKKNPVYRLKKKLIEAIYKILILET